jgi:hypothetical protein
MREITNLAEWHHIVNELAQQTMRGNLLVYWRLPLIGISMEELIWVPCEFRHPSVANYFTVDLAGLKEMTQDLAELLGLAIPVSYRKQAHQGTGHQPHQGHPSQPFPGSAFIDRTRITLSLAWVRREIR